MEVYFYSNKNLDSHLSKDLISYLGKLHIAVNSNLLPSEDSSNSLEKSDVVILHDEKIDSKFSYLIASALAYNKKILCIFPKGAKLQTDFEDLVNTHDLSKKVDMQFYENDLVYQVAQFLKLLDAVDTKETFNIKFTLRISKKLADYMNWKSAHRNIKKADWLRHKIEQMMKNDEEYNDFLKNRFDVKK